MKYITVSNFFDARLTHGTSVLIEARTNKPALKTLLTVRQFTFNLAIVGHDERKDHASTRKQITQGQLC